MAHAWLALLLRRGAKAPGWRTLRGSGSGLWPAPALLNDQIGFSVSIAAFDATFIPQT